MVLPPPRHPPGGQLCLDGGSGTGKFDIFSSISGSLMEPRDGFCSPPRAESFAFTHSKAILVFHLDSWGNRVCYSSSSVVKHFSRRGRRTLAGSSLLLQPEHARTLQPAAPGLSCEPLCRSADVSLFHVSPLLVSVQGQLVLALCKCLP